MKIIDSWLWAYSRKVRDTVITQDSDSPCDTNGIEKTKFYKNQNNEISLIQKKGWMTTDR